MEQLWRPAVDADAVRVVVDERPPAGWREVESYWLVPNADRASLVLPRAGRRVTAAAAVNYRRLRPPAPQVVRATLGLLARSSLPLSPSRLSILAREGDAAAIEMLPLPMLARALDLRRLFAATGVRRVANRKATLHLLSESGSPVGFGKVAWNDVTRHFVRTEASVLREVGGRAGATRAPALLAEVDYHGQPILVTEPLPLSVRRSSGRQLVPPTPQELFAVCPVVRLDRIAQTQVFRRLQSRLSDLASDPVSAPVAQRALRLAGLVAASGRSVPVAARWHGDFTPWNTARDQSGQLWAWDWESSEPDVPAGLDALHWSFSVLRLANRTGGDALSACVDDAVPALRAAGVAPDAWNLLTALYTLTVVERAADLATRAGSWADVWITPAQLTSLLERSEEGLNA